ncbi:hypothetical protein RRG08_051358 [Elysia crispata]|uniref:Uncharacterized protein n=1 Tax=Elysia crispata TaxID=231223 RepID=A0AAE1B5P0_9GAST|nr:hypothetical protein RRG08_051358 [Elysia crispata]
MSSRHIDCPNRQMILKEQDEGTADSRFIYSSMDQRKPMTVKINNKATSVDKVDVRQYAIPVHKTCEMGTADTVSNKENRDSHTIILIHQALRIVCKTAAYCKNAEA